MSLVPSVTETLLAWGITPIAVTRFCEHPELPNIGGTKDPDVTAILALEPDLVVLDDEENRRPDAEALTAGGLRIHVTHVRAVSEVAPTLARLAEALGVPAPAEMASIPVAPLLLVPAGMASAGVAGGSGPGADDGPVRAFVPIWRRPWMTLDHDTYGSSVLAALGVVNVFADHPDRYPTVTVEEIRARTPDVVLAPTEPYPFAARHLAELATLAPEVRLVDGQDLFWWGVRTPAALDRLRIALSAQARSTSRGSAAPNPT